MILCLFWDLFPRDGLDQLCLPSWRSSFDTLPVLGPVPMARTALIFACSGTCSHGQDGLDLRCFPSWRSSFDGFLVGLFVGSSHPLPFLVDVRVRIRGLALLLACPPWTCLSFSDAIAVSALHSRVPSPLP